MVAIGPSVTFFYFSRFYAVDFNCWQADRNGCFTPINTAGRFNSNNSITPLIASSRLRLAIFIFMRVRRVVTLRRLMNRFHGKGAIANFSIRAFLGTIFNRRVICDSILTCFAHGIWRDGVFRPVMIVRRFNIIEYVTIGVGGS